MTQPEYEQKKRECWEEFKQENLDGEVQWQPVSRYDVFCAAFDRAYALGKLQASYRQVKEAITQEEIEKAAEKFADEIKIPPSAHGVMVPFINGLAHDSYLQGAQDFIGKQEKDAEDTVIQGWVARDKNGLLSLFRLYRPERGYDYNGEFGEWGTSIGYKMTIPNRLFPDLTWDSDPELVEIIIKRKKK